MATPAQAQVDPGVRGGGAGAGAPFADLTDNEHSFFEVGLEDFEEAEGVGEGMGPRFNLDGCAGCHLQPAVGGTSPAVNPQVAVATAFGAQNTVPSFITSNGPVREARFKFNPDGSRDGGVHALFTIRGRIDGTGDASGCNAVQDDFAREVARNNVIFRIPTPTFGAGLMEMIPDQTIDQQRQREPEHESGARHQRASQPQRQRRHDLALRLEGAEPVAAAVLRRGVQRRDGHLERAVPGRA